VSTEPRKYGLFALHDELDRLLRARYTALIVEAEVAQISLPSSGHAYLLLRDRDRARGDTSLSVVVWRDDWRRFTYKPEVGHRVLVRGTLGVFASRGGLNLYATGIARAGDGAWAAELNRRVARLTAEGLLDPRRKRALPAFPMTIGLATSPTGAAIADFLRVSRDRFPAARVLVAPCQVQGPLAAPSVLRAVELLIEDGRAEVIVVARGGGSKEDLLPFQDEHLARFLAGCPIPVVTAVGHEIDTTLVDLVADAVASTPSAAAVRVLPDRGALIERVDAAELRALAAIRRRLSALRLATQQQHQRLRHPTDRMRRDRERVDALLARLDRAVTWRLERSRGRVAAAAGRLGPVGPGLVPARRRQLDGLERRLQAAARAVVSARQHRFARAAGRLDALSPVAVLARGYAIVTRGDEVIRDAATLSAGDAVSVRVGRGRFWGRVVDAPE
jgi:exodeoxyribonuclease VII large subunit